MLRRSRSRLPRERSKLDHIAQAIAQSRGKGGGEEERSLQGNNRIVDFFLEIPIISVIVVNFLKISQNKIVLKVFKGFFCIWKNSQKILVEFY